MKKLFSFLLPALLSQSLQAQVKLSASPGPAHASALLELESTSQGVLLPRMTKQQRGQIASPAIGLLIYNTTTQRVEVYRGTGWVALQTSVRPDPPAPGADFTAPHGTNAVAFSANTACAGQWISAGHSSLSCNGDLVIGNNAYPRVLINGQCWMGKNLNEAPSNYPYDNSWTNTSLADVGRWGYYHSTATNGTLGFRATEPAAGEGRLYQWSAAMNGSTTERAQGACPAGWHVPSDCEWMYLEHGLGMTETDQVSTGARSSGSVGQQLKSAAAGGTNTKSFSALMAGYRDPANGSFLDRTTATVYWTSTESAAQVQYRVLSASSASVSRGVYDKAYALSLRCLAD